MANQTVSHKKDVALGETKRTDKPIKFTPKKDIYWDDWGHMRRVFRKGEVYNGVLHSDGEVTAESPAYGVSDYVDASEIEIL